MLRLRAAEKPCHRQLRSELRVIAWPAPLLGEYFCWESIFRQWVASNRPMTNWSASRGDHPQSISFV